MCGTSDSFYTCNYNLTDSSLITVDYQQRFLACTFFGCNKTADEALYAHMNGHILHIILACNHKRMCIIVVTPGLYAWDNSVNELIIILGGIVLTRLIVQHTCNHTATCMITV